MKISDVILVGGKGKEGTYGETHDRVHNEVKFSSVVDVRFWTGRKWATDWAAAFCYASYKAADKARNKMYDRTGLEAWMGVSRGSDHDSETDLFFVFAGRAELAAAGIDYERFYKVEAFFEGGSHAYHCARETDSFTDGFDLADVLTASGAADVELALSRWLFPPAVDRIEVDRDGNRIEGGNGS